MSSLSPQNLPHKLRLAIIGGGIGGLALAFCLSQIENSAELIDIDIYEAASQITQAGAGISVWPRTWEILMILGLEETLIKYLGTPEVLTARRVMTFRKGDQRNGFDFAEVANAGGVTFHRAELQEALISKISSRYHVHLSHKLITYNEKDNHVELKFQNGATKECDFLVGADGVKSATRRKFLTDKSSEDVGSIEPVWTGTNAYRGLISGKDMAKLLPDHPALTKFMVYCGKHKHVVSYPISQGSLVNVVALYSDPEKEGTLVKGPLFSDATVDEVVSKYEGWDEQVVSHLKLLQKPTKWAMQKLKPMKYYAAGRVLLLGDAAHAMPPHLGSGGGQAIEDAYIFSVLLHTALREKKPLSEVSRIYNTIRVPVGNQAMEASMRQGALSDFDVPGVNDDIQDDDDTVSWSQLQATAEAIKKNWEFVVEPVEPYKKKAMDMLMGGGISSSKL